MSKRYDLEDVATILETVGKKYRIRCDYAMDENRDVEVVVVEDEVLITEGEWIVNGHEESAYMVEEASSGDVISKTDSRWTAMFAALRYVLLKRLRKEIADADAEYAKAISVESARDSSKLEMVRSLIAGRYNMKEIPSAEDFRVTRMMSRVGLEYVRKEYEKICVK